MAQAIRGAVAVFDDPETLERGHRAAAETDGRDLQLTEPATLHAVPPINPAAGRGGR